jgi:hypothetical protein
LLARHSCFAAFTFNNGRAEHSVVAACISVVRRV